MSKHDDNLTLSRFLADVEKRAFRMAHFATGDKEEALDIVQDTMMSLVKRYANKEPDQWRPLFYRILNNRIKDHYRRAKTKSMVFGWFGRSSEEEDAELDPIAQSPDLGANVVEQVKADRAMVALDDAIRQLPQRQQQAVMLRLWEGLDVAQTAQAMGCSDGSVKTHYSRAVAKLRESLGDHWP